jgi:hypothetical protein
MGLGAPRRGAPYAHPGPGESHPACAHNTVRFGFMLEGNYRNHFIGERPSSSLASARMNRIVCRLGVKFRSLSEIGLTEAGRGHPGVSGWGHRDAAQLSLGAARRNRAYSRGTQAPKFFKIIRPRLRPHSPSPQFTVTIHDSEHYSDSSPRRSSRCTGNSTRTFIGCPTKPTSGTRCRQGP